MGDDELGESFISLNSTNVPSELLRDSTLLLGLLVVLGSLLLCKVGTLISLNRENDERRGPPVELLRDKSLLGSLVLVRSCCLLMGDDELGESFISLNSTNVPSELLRDSTLLLGLLVVLGSLLLCKVGTLISLNRVDEAPRDLDGLSLRDDE